MRKYLLIFLLGILIFAHGSQAIPPIPAAPAIPLTQKAAVSGVASLNSSSLVVQNPANATATPTVSKIPIADGGGKLDGWISFGGITSSSSGPVSATTALNRQTFVATAAVTYNLPTGDLSAYIGTTVRAIEFTFVKTAAGTLTIDPGTNNFLANGAASKTMTDSVAGETYATITVRLISSAASINTWVIIGAHGTWIATP